MVISMKDIKDKKSKNVLLDSILIWKRIFSFLQGNKPIYFANLILYTGLNTAFTYNFGLLLKNITAGALENDTSVIINGVIAFAVFSVALEGLSWMVCHMHLSNSKAKAEFAIRNTLFRHLLIRPLTTEAEAHTGDALSRLVSDGDQVANALSWDTFGILWPLVNMLFCGVITLYYSWQIGLTTIALGLVFMFLTSKVSVPMRKISKKTKEAQSKANQHMLDYLTGAQTVRLLGIELPLIRRFEKATGEVKGLAVKNTVLNAWYNTIGTAIGVVSSGLVLIIGMALVTAGQMTLPNVLLVYTFSTTTVYSMINIGNSLTQFQNVAASAQRYVEVLDSPAEDKRGEKPDVDAVKQPNAPVLEVDSLVFQYREELSPALNGVSFTVQEGEHIALVGESGSGKSTIFRLLLGFYPPNEGDIRLYGNRYTDANLDSLRRQYAYVAQESPLFDGTIGENIAMSKKDTTEEQLTEAAIQANAHPFITEFSNGYDEEVGELGVQISGGQRQRVAIARALLRNSPILLLDEATSSLDSQNEQLVQSALDRFMNGRTTIVAAHRLSTVQNADRILVFDKGRIVESGSHQQLLQQSGVYAGLVAAQAIV